MAWWQYLIMGALFVGWDVWVARLLITGLRNREFPDYEYPFQTDPPWIKREEDPVRYWLRASFTVALLLVWNIGALYVAVFVAPFLKN